ncbi:conserved hypothetical protein [Agrobacterium deltaense RV3]|nr:conserved hypothetical protein [Agrobacterium deltaense RV3]
MLDARKKRFVHRRSLRRNPAPYFDGGQIISEASHWSNILSSSTPRPCHACGNTASAFSNWLLLKQRQGKDDDSGFFPQVDQNNDSGFDCDVFIAINVLIKPAQQAGTISQWPRVDLLSQARRKDRWRSGRFMRDRRCFSHPRASSSSLPS